MSLQIDNEKLILVYDVLVGGIRTYIKENGFEKIVIGLSGGIDSAVVCALAKEAVGPENVLGIAMPSKYSKKTGLAWSYSSHSYLQFLSGLFLFQSSMGQPLYFSRMLQSYSY